MLVPAPGAGLTPQLLRGLGLELLLALAMLGMCAVLPTAGPRTLSILLATSTRTAPTFRLGTLSLVVAVLTTLLDLTKRVSLVEYTGQAMEDLFQGALELGDAYKHL